ncbi:hypothetical protein INR49_024821 [Caranx melampygus]|nr:hypothetical protein INR49_024821 [Caranx melampygus]
MEGKGPYRIYDPGGSEVKARDEAGGGSSYRQLLEENSILRERMKGLKSLGDLLEESQSEASRLRQRVEELVRDNEALKSSSFAASLCMGGPVQSETQIKPCLHPNAEQKEEQTSCLGKTLQPEKPTEALSEFEVVNIEGKTPDALTVCWVSGRSHPLLPQENIELASQLKRLESSFSIFAEESNPNQLLAHLGRMAVEFHHLSSKVQKNEQRTSLLQTLCEQLRQENNELRKKMEEDHHIRNRDLEQLRQENQKLKELVTGGTAAAAASAAPSDSEAPEAKEEPSGKAAEKTPTKPCDVEVYEKKIKLLEKQRKDVLEVNKQWDIQWNSMKSQFEQKITDLRQRLAESQKTVLELEAEREQRQRDYDKKLLLAKSKIENVQGEKECLNSETTELKQKIRYLQDQVLLLSKQREYQEKEIQRLNRLHQAQNECQRERTERCKLERLQMHHKQGQQQERRTSDPTSGSVNGPLSPPYCGPFVQVGPQGLEGWPIHFPPRMPNAAGAAAAAAAAPPPVRDFQPVTPISPQLLLQQPQPQDLEKGSDRTLTLESTKASPYPPNAVWVVA